MQKSNQFKISSSAASGKPNRGKYKFLDKHILHNKIYGRFEMNHSGVKKNCFYFIEAQQSY
jgi:hypothetical protein